jgi:hypothetical protein
MNRQDPKKEKNENEIGRPADPPRKTVTGNPLLLLLSLGLHRGSITVLALLGALADWRFP